MGEPILETEFQTAAVKTMILTGFTLYYNNNCSKRFSLISAQNLVCHI